MRKLTNDPKINIHLLNRRKYEGLKNIPSYATNMMPIQMSICIEANSVKCDKGLSRLAPPVIVEHHKTL